MSRVVLRNNIPRVSSMAHQYLGEAVERTAATVLSRSQERAPKDTGEGAASGFYEMVTDLEAVVGFSAEHMLYQELGTSRMAAQPFLVPSLEEQAQPFQEAIIEAIDRAAKEATR
jgi:phage protein, HK97 gp10 family